MFSGACCRLRKIIGRIPGKAVKLIIAHFCNVRPFLKKNQKIY